MSQPTTSIITQAISPTISFAPTDSDPIIAIATAPGRGGVGIIRIMDASFGNTAPTDVQKFILALCHQPLSARQATYLPFYDQQQNLIDRGLAIYFSAPNYYTGENILELQIHGGPVVLQLLLNQCLQLGARDTSYHLSLAQPGEFTKRAFLNDKMDLAQA
ncbi:hypothetical protein ACTFIZ_012358 [Dictyostelium cf. discoideum]